MAHRARRRDPGDAGVQASLDGPRSSRSPRVRAGIQHRQHDDQQEAPGTRRSEPPRFTGNACLKMYWTMTMVASTRRPGEQIRLIEDLELQESWIVNTRRTARSQASDAPELASARAVEARFVDLVEICAGRDEQKDVEGRDTRW